MSSTQGHLLWQAGRTIANYLEEHKSEVVQNKTVLELGAGAGLPSLICGINGAKAVVVTDYPDAELIENLRLNVEGCASLPKASKVRAAGYLWGADTAELQNLVPEMVQEGGFDLLILADLLFNHSEHTKLLQSIQRTLKKAPDALALVFFTPYRPWLLEKDLAFFALAKEGGFVVEKILEHVMDKVMFDEDPGVCYLSSTVCKLLIIVPGRASAKNRFRISSDMGLMDRRECVRDLLYSFFYAAAISTKEANGIKCVSLLSLNLVAELCATSL